MALFPKPPSATNSTVHRRKEQEQQKRQQRQPSKRYGDLISAAGYGLCLTAILAREFVTMSSSSSDAFGSRPLFWPVVVSHVLTVSCGLASYQYHHSSSSGGAGSGDNNNNKNNNNQHRHQVVSLVLSVMTIIGDTVTIGLLNAVNFLQYADSSLLLELIWVYLMIGANFDWSFPLKASLGLVTLLLGILCVHCSQLPVPVGQTNQWLVLATVIHTAVSYLVSYPPAHVDMDYWTVHGARAVLAATFCHHLWSEISIITLHPDRAANAGTAAAVQACVLAVAGLASVGTFSRQIHATESLQALVNKRTRELQKQQDELHMVGLALQASETAIAIIHVDNNKNNNSGGAKRTAEDGHDDHQCQEDVDSSDDYNHQHVVLWCNPALQRMAQATLGATTTTIKEQGGESSLTTLSSCQNRSLVELLSLDSSNAQRFRQAFSRGRHSGIGINADDDIHIGPSIYNVDVTPFPQQSSSSSLSSSSNDDACNNDKPEPNRYVVAFKDMTEYRKLEKAEKAAEREAMMSKAMIDSMEVLTHELRTPLQGIMGVTSMLLQQQQQGIDPLPSSAVGMLELIMASSGLLLVLINNLLDIRKFNANLMDDLQLAPTPSAPPMKDAADFCRPLATISNVKLEIDFRSTEYAIVQSNTLRLQQILINLLSNAIKYTPEGGTVVLRSFASSVKRVQEMMNEALATGWQDNDQPADPEEQVLVFQVIDSGSGIPPGEEESLFRKFAQLQNKDKGNKNGGKTAGQPHGTGLGLNLVKTFSRLLQGRVWVSNGTTEGTGAIFSVCLPLVSNMAPKSPLRASTPSREKSPKPGFEIASQSLTEKSIPRYRVLVVDDTLINRKVIQRMLKQVDCIKIVDTVESGKLALEKLHNGKYNFVISDVQMPEMDGFQLSRKIRECKSLKDIPLVVGLTADTSQWVQDQCIASGMVDVIHKPITLLEMKEYFHTTVAGVIPRNYRFDA